MRRLVVAAMAGLALPALLSTSATAGEPTSDEVVLRDATGDVWKAPVGGDVFSPAPDQRKGDITRAVLAYREHAVVARLRFARLEAGAPTRVELDMRTDLGRRHANVTWSAAHPAGSHHLWGAGGDRVDCAGMTHLVDLDAAVVRLRIPSRCLGGPEWVRGAVMVHRDTRTMQWVDNPHSDSSLPDGMTRRLYRP